MRFIHTIAESIRSNFTVFVVGYFFFSALSYILSGVYLLVNTTNLYAIESIISGVGIIIVGAILLLFTLKGKKDQTRKYYVFLMFYLVTTALLSINDIYDADFSSGLINTLLFYGDLGSGILLFIFAIIFIIGYAKDSRVAYNISKVFLVLGTIASLAYTGFIIYASIISLAAWSSGFVVFADFVGYVLLLLGLPLLTREDSCVLD